jgi:predicted Ser/Thr protein kinase
MALTYPKKYKKDINLEIWDTAIINSENANERDLNGFLLHRMAYYKDSEYNDTVLWEYIREDFIEWIKKTWAPINKDIVWDFRNFLWENGVFVPINGGNIGDNI